ncbi:MAG: hypothetical protein ACI8UO_003144 [Verrucomicrobiales bacterium]|jgi:hypothetical protein
MKLNLLLLPLACSIGLSSCVKREILATESSWTTLDDTAWDKPGQTGTKKKRLFSKEEPTEKRRLDQIFDEATDAQATLSAAFAGQEVEGDVKRPSYSDKRFGAGEFERRPFGQRDQKSGAQNQPFEGMRIFGRESFEGVVTAPSSDRPAVQGSQKSNLPKVFRTNKVRGADARVGMVTATPDDRRFRFRGDNRGSREDSSLSIQPRPSYSPDGSGMSVDDVRRVLHPGDYKEGS